jgi:deoxycytidylate deaminase
MSSSNNIDRSSNHIESDPLNDDNDDNIDGSSDDADHVHRRQLLMPTDNNRRRSDNNNQLSSQPPAPLQRVTTKTKLSEQFYLYDWTPDPKLSDDENYLDLVFIITRNTGGRPNTSQSSQHPSQQQQQPQGHMGALIVRPTSTSQLSTYDKTSAGCSDRIMMSDKNNEKYESRIWDNILGAATNTPLFISDDDDNDCDNDRHGTTTSQRKTNNKKNNKSPANASDIHAEISALGQACKSSQSTEGCTAYITIHPCKRCFGALVAFGITTIVTRQSERNWSSVTLRTAQSRGIVVRTLSYDEQRRQMERINMLVNGAHHAHEQQGGGGGGGGHSSEGEGKGIRSDEDLMAIAEEVRRRRQERKQAKKQQQQQQQCQQNRSQQHDDDE